MVRTCAGDSRCFEVNVGLYQGSVPLLFSTVMDVVMKEARSGLPCGLPWEFLYANVLVLMATIMDQLIKKLVRASLLIKGLNVNVGKTKLMVDGGVVTEFCAWPHGDCSKGIVANSLQCTSYIMKWVQRRCSGAKGSLQTASAAFICEKCQGETPPLVMPEEGLVVDGEKYDIVDSFCYFKKFREMAPF